MITTWITDALMEFLGWILDPTTFISAAFKVFGWLTQGVGYVMGGDTGTQFMAMGATIGGVPFQEAWKFLTYCLSPYVDPVLLTACVGIVIDAWVLTVILKLIVYIKNTFWSAAA